MELAQVENSLEYRLNKFWKQFQDGLLSKGDIISLFLLSYCELFPTKNWLCWSSTRQHSKQPIQSSFFPKKETVWSETTIFKKVPVEFSLGQIINQSVFRKETLRANLGLVHVYTQPETIKILDYIPTPIQMLEIQAHGFRCVTLLRDPVWFQHIFEHNRNIRDFVIHDLEHIWQMFEHSDMTQQQTQFSKKLFELTVTGQFDELRNDPQFAGEFNYIISDMNTHPAHMYATLKSLINRQKSLSEDILSHFKGLVSEVYHLL